MNLLLSEEKSLQVIEKIISAGIDYSYDPEKHKLEINPPAVTGNMENKVFFRLPLSLPFPAVPAISKKKPLHYVILLIQSGQCAMGYFEGKENLDHKVFRSYMVRKKQGKSQIKYLKTKGKSRAGSRVRLAETLEFFENINGRLQDYFKENEVEKIAISCSKTLIPYLFNAKVATPFDKRDERIFKIPMHVNTPTYEILIDVQNFSLKGELIYDDVHKTFIGSLIL